MNTINGSNSKNKKAKDINLKELLLIIKKRLWIIVVISIITTILGTYYNNYRQSNNTPIYQSSSRIIIGATPENRNTLQVIMKDPIVLGKVVEKLNLEQSPESLAEHITVNSIDDSQVVSISVLDSDPERAASIANTTAEVFKEEIPKIMDFKDVRYLSDAKVNTSPINQSNNNKLIIIAFILGLVIGVGLVFLLDSLDETIRDDREVEELLGIPVLGKVPKMNRKNVNKKGSKQYYMEMGGETIDYK
jgi:capsular polysaccharide biosynthesis protein